MAADLSSGVWRAAAGGILTLAMVAGCAQNGGGAAAAAQTGTVARGEQTETQGERPAEGQPCRPLETRDANAAGQQPTFRGQTRVCAEPTNVAFDVSVIAKGLASPWAVEPLPDGGFLITEQPGRMRIVSASGVLGEPIAGVPEVDAGRQGGLLDVALGPNFATDRTIYWSFTEPRQGGNGTSVARGVLSADGRRLEQVRVIFRALPTYDNGMHFGSRVVFGPDGMLYVTLGERSDREMREHAQRLDSHLGTIVRITPDGEAPRDNPFVGRQNARPEIWTLGHRNVQAAAFDPQGRFWVVEHGPRGGDELNLIEKGKNYGWPVVSFGEEYSGRSLGAETTRSGYVDPVYYWDPVIAPSGAELYTGNVFPAWRGSLFTGGLASKRLVRLSIENNRVTGEEHLLEDRGERIRDVRQGPDGFLYVITDERNGELWRIAPRR